MTSTNYASKIHTYHGHTIYPCEHAKGEHRGRWTILTYHKTGMPYSDESSPHFWTLTAAKEFIDERPGAKDVVAELAKERE